MVIHLAFTHIRILLEVPGIPVASLAVVTANPGFWMQIFLRVGRLGHTGVALQTFRFIQDRTLFTTLSGKVDTPPCHSALLFLNFVSCDIFALFCLLLFAKVPPFVEGQMKSWSSGLSSYPFNLFCSLFQPLWLQYHPNSPDHLWYLYSGTSLLLPAVSSSISPLPCSWWTCTRV